MDLKGIIKRVRFSNGDQMLKNNFIKILSEYDEIMMKKFLKFVTNVEKPPNFSIDNSYYINVSFIDNLSKLLFAGTCFNQLSVPAYQSIELMKEKLEYVICNCIEMDKA